MAQAWQQLTRAEYDEVWDRFYEEFAFRPSVKPADLPGIREPHPSVTWALKPSGWTEDDEKQLNRLFLAAFQRCTAASEPIYVLDWQHPCYWLQPHVVFDDWPIPVLPNGDYHIFLARDFTWGVFGHPWEWTMCCFGVPLLDALADHNLPQMLEHEARRT